MKVVSERLGHPNPSFTLRVPARRPRNASRRGAGVLAGGVRRVTTSCGSRDLLLKGADRRLAAALARYPAFYDDVLHAVHLRLAAQGAAAKIDLAALIAWKHVRNAPWMKKLLELPEAEVWNGTAQAFAAELSDENRIAALDFLPGFGGRGAFASVLLTAWDPSRFGVLDKFVVQHRPDAIDQACTCNWWDLPTYWEHLRRIADECQEAGKPWTARRVEMALFNLQPRLPLT